MQVGQVRLSLANSNVQNKIIPTVNEYLEKLQKDWQLNNKGFLSQLKRIARQQQNSKSL
jgi:hypothetical protein